MTQIPLASYLDATNLKLDATDGDLCSLCDEAAQNEYASVCIYPASVPICSSILYDTPVAVCTVIGFPHGRSSMESKKEEILRAAENGAQEVDIVMNYAALRAREKSLVTEEIAALCRVARELGLLSKIIVETCYLNRQQKLQALSACEAAGAEFIKTSTGFGSAGATVEDVKLFKEERIGSIRIKASGGIRTTPQALAMIEAGAERLGVSAASKIIGEYKGETTLGAQSSDSY